MPYRLAIIEDNATARSAIRSHLLPMGEFEISSFSNGSELKAALRRQNFEIILMDFHLGQGRNGVEWVQQLRQSQFIRPSTGIIFITADRLPQTVGQIIDTQPDLFVIKPYNIATLTRGLKHYLSYRSFVKQALDALDNNDAENALRIINQLDSEQTPGRLKNDVVKLHARILFQLGKLLEAKKLYETVLAHSDKVLWAQWGKIKCEYLAGNWSHCRNELSDLMTNSLARDKAFEWLACLCFEQEAWSQAEFYLDHIKISELSVPATRLKSLTYQKQDKVIEGIELLQKKRDYNRSTRERFNEFTVELAEFYLSIAEQQPKTNRDESLSQARRLIGIASRAQVDQQQIQKKDYLLAFAASLEDDHDKVTQILSLEHMDLLSRTDPATLTIAAKTHNAIGNSEKARELLAMAHERNHLVGNLASQTLNEQVLTNAELDMGMAEERSLELNNTGMRLFIGRDYIRAMYYFYQAYQMQPSTAAFGLNLVQCMLESRHANYRSYTVPALLSKLDVGALNNSNRKRLHQLRTQAQAEASFFYAEQTPDNENAQDSAS
ncbi:response regulator [Alteromonas confluentis]|nr:response regulator [Alteromonas confluentis]